MQSSEELMLRYRTLLASIDWFYETRHDFRVVEVNRDKVKAAMKLREQIDPLGMVWDLYGKVTK